MAWPIIFKHVSYSYHQKRSAKALSNVSFHIIPGSFTMIVGKTGSGKSTLVQQINGLLRPTAGNVKVGPINVKSKMSNYNLLTLRKRVGLVFQVAQDQLFGETVQDDLSFGPKNFGFSINQIKESVFKSARALDLSQTMLSKSPFDLSGGQMKRVAIASVLACHPQILLLDEPTIGLDNFGKRKIMTLLQNLNKRYHLTIIMVTHQMDLVAKYATQVLVMNKGRLLTNTTPIRLFKAPDLLRRADLVLPFAPRFAVELLQRGVTLKQFPLDSVQLAQAIKFAWETRRYRE